MKLLVTISTLLLAMTLVSQTAIAEDINGTVVVAGRPVGGAEVTLWKTAGKAAPKSMKQVSTDSKGAFKFRDVHGRADGDVFYLTTKSGAGGAGALMSVLGTKMLPEVVVNELTTVASVFTNARFINDTAISGNPLGLRIAAGNAPNLVDPRTGTWGKVVLDPINSTQTTTLATLNTLGSLITASFTVADDDWRARFFKAATPPDGVTPKNTLEALAGIARAPWAKAKTLYGLFNEVYPQPKDGARRKAPFVPYLAWVPDDFALSLVFGGGGIYASGNLAIDAEGNVWGTQNWMPGSQSTGVHNIGGGVSKLAPNGTALSPAITGFTGMGIDGTDWGIAVTQDRVWANSFTGATLLMDLDGNPIGKQSDFPLGRLGQPQGIAVAPNGDVWMADSLKNNLVHFPGGRVQDERRVEVKGLVAPFAVTVDNQNRVWVSNALDTTVVRFPAEDPSKVESFEVGNSPFGISLDSKGNLWVASFYSLDFPPPKYPPGATQLEIFELGGIHLFKTLQSNPGMTTGIISMIRADGTQPEPKGYTGGKAINAPWSVSVDGNDDVWVANFYGQGLLLMAGADQKGHPPGTKTGDVIHTFQSGSIQHVLATAVDPAGNVWVNNNWKDFEIAISDNPPRRKSTWGGGHGLTVVYGVAAPLKTPHNGQVQQP